MVTKCSASKEQLKSTKEDIKELLRTQFYHPILAHYVGNLQNGKVFDSSYNRGKPLTFRVGVGESLRLIKVFRHEKWYGQKDGT